MSDAKPSHGINFAMELNPSGSQGAFTRVAEVQDFNWPDFERGTTEVTPHEDTWDSYVIAGRVKRGPVTFDINFVYSNATHEESTGGLYQKLLQGTLTGFRTWGPDGQAGTDEWIMSGYVTSINGRQAPVREGAETASIAIQPSGSMIMDGAVITPA